MDDLAYTVTAGSDGMESGDSTAYSSSSIAGEAETTPKRPYTMEELQAMLNDNEEESHQTTADDSIEALLDLLGIDIDEDEEIEPHDDRAPYTMEELQAMLGEDEEQDIEDTLEALLRRYATTLDDDLDVDIEGGGGTPYTLEELRELLGEGGEGTSGIESPSVAAEQQQPVEIGPEPVKAKRKPAAGARNKPTPSSATDVVKVGAQPAGAVGTSDDSLLSNPLLWAGGLIALFALFWFLVTTILQQGEPMDKTATYRAPSKTPAYSPEPRPGYEPLPGRAGSDRQAGYGVEPYSPPKAMSSSDTGSDKPMFSERSESPISPGAAGTTRTYSVPMAMQGDDLEEPISQQPAPEPISIGDRDVPEPAEHVSEELGMQSEKDMASMEPEDQVGDAEPMSSVVVASPEAESSMEPSESEPKSDKEPVEEVMAPATAMESAPSGSTRAPDSSDSGTRGEWTINLHSILGNREAAGEVLRQLQQQGIDARMEQVTLNGDIWYRINVGGFASREEANAYTKSINKRTGHKHFWLYRTDRTRR